VSHGTLREFDRLLKEEAERLARDESFSDSEKEQLIELKKTSLRTELGMPQVPRQSVLSSYPSIR
jgi:hypothetical protein